MKTNKRADSILCSSDDGPIFGYYDIFIADNANDSSSSYSCLGRTYHHPVYAKGSYDAASFLAGSFYFKLDEIEVYQKETA